MFANISYIPSSFEDEELELFESKVLELFPIEVKPWFENEAMISKSEILQLEWKVKKKKNEWEMLPII